MPGMRDFPEALRAHFDAPHHVGEPPGGADLRGEARNPACGDHLVIYLACADGRVTAAGFRAQGCPAAMATASAACSVLEGQPADPALSDALEPLFTERFGEPRAAHRHALALCVAALQGALSEDGG
jgi:NifU-like protein involved in Fe-S cluster formation